MDDKELSIGVTECSAWLSWTLAVTGVLLGWTLGVSEMGQVGIISGAIAATLHVRSFLCKQADYLSDQHDEQEAAISKMLDEQVDLIRNAFELGRDFEAMQQSPKVKRIPIQSPSRNGSEVPR